MTARVTDTDRGARALAESLRALGKARVRVGVLADAPKKTGTRTGKRGRQIQQAATLAEVAAAHEFVALQHGGGRGHFIGAQLQTAGRHGDGGQAACGWWCCLRIGLCMCQTGAPQREDGGQGHGVQGWVAMCSAASGWAKGVRVVCHDCVAIEIGGRAGRHAAFRPGGRKPSKI